MKKYILIVFLLFYAIVVVEGQVATIGDYRTVTTGNWNTLSIWQVRTGINSWTTATILPSASNNVYIQAGHLITVSLADANCKDLHLYNNVNAITISSTFNINIYGKIRAISAPAVAEVNAAADGLYTGTSVGTGLNAMIVTSGTGLMRFVGGSRIITNSLPTPEWTSAGNSHNTEFALDVGAIGTLQTGYKGKKIVFSSGNFSITGSSLIACSQTLTDSSVVIRSGVRLITDATGKYAIAGSSTLKCGAIYLLSGGILEFTGAAPYISTAKFLNSGTIVYSGTNQSLLACPLATDVSNPAPLNSDSLNRYTNVVFKNSTKTAVSDISVSGSFFDSTATTLNMVAFKFGGLPTTITNNGIITTQNNSTAPIPAGYTWGGTVTFANPLGGQTIVLGNYANLTISSTNASNPNTFSSGTIGVSETFSVAKTASNNVIRHITTGNTINFNKLISGQPIPAFYYNNLIVSSAATPPSPSNYTLAADSIYIAGTFNPGSFPNYYVITGNTINFNNPTGGQTIPKFNFNHLVVSNTSAPTNTICVADTIGIAGIFTPGNFVNNYTTTGNTINFNSTLASPGQTIPVFNYYNLIFSNTGATTYNVLAGNINVANSLRQSGKKGLAPGVNSVVYAPNATFYFTGNATDTLYNNSPQWSDVNGPTNVTLDGTSKFVFQQTAPVNSFVVNTVQLTGNIATITTAVNHNFSVGNIVTIGSLSSSEYGYLFGGTFTITSTTANTFSFSLINSDVPATPVTGGVALKNVFKTVTGTFKIDNAAILLIGYGNTLKMANGSTIFRNQSASKITLNSGCLIFGNSSTDKINVTIGNTMASDNEFAYLTNPGGYGTLKLLSGTYTPSGSRTIVDLDAKPGTILDLTDLSNYTINGNILSTGTISAKPNANLIMGGANAGSSGKLLFTPGFQTLGSLKIIRTGLNAEVPLGSNVSLSNYLDLTSGSLLDSGYVITNLGSIQGVSGFHVSTGSGKIMMTGVNTISRSIKGGAFTLGNLDINAGSNTILDSTSFFVAKDLTLSSGYYATSAGTSYITNLSGNLLGNSFYTGPGKIKMIGPGKKVAGVNVSNLEIALPSVSDFIYASDTTRISSNLILSSGNFRDSGKIITVDGNISGPGTHASSSSGKIKMVGVGTISVSGIAFGNLEIASAAVTGSTSFNVNDNLTLSSGAIMDLNSNMATVSGNVFGTGSQIGGAGKIKMIGSNKTISGISASNLEIATATNDSITAVGPTNVTSTTGGIYLTSGKFNDGGNTITCNGNLFGPSVHNSAGNGEIKFIGAGKFISGYPSLSNIEIAPGASLNAGCAASISGTLLMNGGNISIGNGNILNFKNNATIIRTTGNLNLDTGTVVMGVVPSDLVNVYINGNLLSTNELPGSHIANIDLTINNGFSYTIKSNNKNVRNLNVNNGRLLCLFDTLTRNPYNLTVSDLVNVNGDFYLDSTQYDFPGNTFGPFKVGPSLIVNSNGKLKFGNVNNKTFYSNGLLVLKSKNLGTASVGDVTNGGLNSGNKIMGVATVERFISNIRNLSANSDPTVKAWRIISMPTKHDFQTIKQAWQEGGSLNSNPNPGYGIQITSNGANWASNGFDTLSNAPSVKYFDPVSNSYGGILTTNAPFEQGKAYMVFVRGSRAKTQLGQLPDTTTLREKGSLNVGDTTINIGSGANQFVCVANPYPSSIDFWALPKTNLTSFLYLYDPRLNAYGAFQTIASNGAAVPGGGSYSTGIPTIQSSQGFFVKTTTGAGSISFKETAKTDGSAMTFRNNDVLSTLRVNVLKSWNNHFELADGIMHVFDSNSSNGFDEQDAVKFNNFYENIGIKIADQNLIIENRNLIQLNDTFFYQIGLRPNNYKLQLIPERIQENGLFAFLEDTYTTSSIPVSLTDTTWIDFSVNADAGSFATNRFRLVFKQQIALPVSFTEVNAVVNNKNAIVNWKVSNELNINNYKIERSANDSTFNEIGTVAASGNTTTVKSYSFTDIAPLSGINYYRIKSIGLSGEVKYSKIVKVVFNNDKVAFTISPNPVNINRELALDVKSIPSGKYDIALYDFSGRKVYTSSWRKTDNNNVLHIKLPSTLPSGDYRLCIKNPWNNFCESLIIK